MPDRSYPPRLANGVVDVFIDLSNFRFEWPVLKRVIAQWTGPEHLGSIVRQVTVSVSPDVLADRAVPEIPGWTFVKCESPLPLLSETLAASGRDGIPLVLILQPVDLSSESIRVPRQALERDPMFGFVVPRTICANGCCVVRLAEHGVGPTDWLPRHILAELPETLIVAELVAPCVLIRPEMLANFGPLGHQFEGTAAAMLHYMASARRCGFRTVLCNRAMVAIDGLTCDSTAQSLPSMSPPDDTLLRQAVPDLERNRREYRAGSWERYEKLCTAGIDTPAHAARPSLLLDLRNLPPIYNGTSQAVLGVAQGFAELGSNWRISILASPQGAAFHSLDRAFADWSIYTALPDEQFTVAFRPAQPWHIQDMVDLHTVALFNAYLMLDTISWDIAYLSPPRVEGTWQFLADYADALMFDSDFTRDRFNERFPARRSVPSLVVHFSFDPNQYVRDDVAGSSNDDDFIFVVGNHLDHKDLRHTVETLATGFPFQRIIALGPADTRSSFVTAHESGTLPQLDVHRLYASARYVVFPSFYEGFGFPLLTALAYGRTVLARRSELVDEIAAYCIPRGRLVVFDRRDDLVDLVGRLMHGEEVVEQPVGLGLTSGRVRNWTDVARQIVEFFETEVTITCRRGWIAREHAVQQLLSYRS